MLMLCFVGSALVVQAEEAAQTNVVKEQKILDRPLMPTGYGLTQLLKKDYYLGRFSIDKAAVYGSVSDLVIIDAARRMEFKFVADRKISGRTFARKIAEGMKINNDSVELKANMAQVKRFMTFFKRPIKKGDVIRFDYHRDFGTRVYFNNRMQGEIPYSTKLYGFLVNIWLGDRPPTAKFKSGLLGQNGDEYALEMQQRYESM
jgi:hypothetical protein